MKNIVLAVTGASGAIYPQIFLKYLKNIKFSDLNVIFSKNALRIFLEETGQDARELWPNIDKTDDFDVPYVSGSAPYKAMVILPCSMGTLGRIANGLSGDTITRAADVFLKEKRQLIVVPRETPLNLIHLENMVKLTQAGATILPAMPSFYSRPQSLEEAAATVVSRVLDHLEIPNDLMARWHTPKSS